MKGIFKKTVGFLLAAAMAFSSFNAFAYTNSICIEDEWGTGSMVYGTGDPFIMKYNGKYYLYVSTMDNQYGFRVWSSDNMADWKFEGNAGVDEDKDITKGAYAPEVTYWNGTFYLYSATPGGAQHRVFTSKSPTGPFKNQGDVLNYADDLIDGSVFIDDDDAATKYFLHAGGSGIAYETLTDDMLRGNSSKHDISGVTVTNAWTEGPGVIKRNGKYYMTYTGNHVISDAYMIEYAAGDSISTLKEPENNLLLINTEEGVVGLGHNSLVVGPDLDSYYIAYHSLDSTGNFYKLGPERHFCIDRLVFNGEKLEVQGPTWWEVGNPKMPEFYDRMENDSNWNVTGGSLKVNDGYMTLDTGAKALSEKTTNPDYSAEFNFNISEYSDNAKAGAYVSYVDENNYAYVYIDPKANTVNLDICVEGVKTTDSAALPEEYTYGNDVLRKITVKKQADVFDVYADDRLEITAQDESGSLGAGHIGMYSENASVRYRYTAFSSTVNGNEDKDTIKPTGSAMDAVHANEISRDFSTAVYTDKSSAALESNYFTGLKTDDSLTYKINPQEGSYYTAEIKAKSESGAKISLYADDELVAEDVDIPSSETFKTEAVRNIPINEDTAELTVEVTDGELDLYSVKLTKLKDIYKPVETQEDMNFEWLEGSWSEDYQTIKTTNSAVWSKGAYGSEYMGDYELSANVSLNAGTDAGLLVRLKYATNSSDKNTGVGGCQKSDYHYGYYAYISTGGVSLGKQMFDWKLLETNRRTLKRNTDYKLTVRAVGDNIKVYLDDELCIDYTDTDNPILSGKVGLRTMNARAEYSGMTLTHLNLPEKPYKEETPLAEGAVKLDKYNFTVLSNDPGKGYQFRDNGIRFHDARRDVKGYINNDTLYNGTVSADIILPDAGCFGVGLMLRAKESAMGNSLDALDGIVVQLERGTGWNLNVNIHTWKNGKWTGAVSGASYTAENYFEPHKGATANLKAELLDNVIKVYLDNGEQPVITADISDYTDPETNNIIGVRSHVSADSTITNFKYVSSDPESSDTSLRFVSVNGEQAQISGDTISAVVDKADEYNVKVWTNHASASAEISQDNGTITVTAENGDKKVYDLNIIVRVPMTGVTLDKTELKLTEGETAALKAAVTPDNTTDEYQLKWSSSNNDAASVDQNGTVKAVKAGEAVITVTAGEFSASCKVTVSAKSAPNPNPNPDDNKPQPSAPSNGVQNGVLYVNGKAVTGSRVQKVGNTTYAVVNGKVATGSKTRVVTVGSYKYIVTKNGTVTMPKKRSVKTVSGKSYVVGTNGRIMLSKKQNKLYKAGTKSYVVKKRTGVIIKSKKGNMLAKIGNKWYVVKKRTGAVIKGKKAMTAKVGKKTYVLKKRTGLVMRSTKKALKATVKGKRYTIAKRTGAARLAK